MDNRSERDLIQKAKQGSREAFTSLVRLFETPLYRFLLARSMHRQDAEDCCQQAFLNAYRYLHSYDERWQFSTWLYRIALRTKKTSGSLAHSPDELIQDQENDPLFQCIAEDDRDNLWLTAKQHLSRDQFDVLWLHYVEDKSVKEVASIKDKGVSWCKVTLHRARRKLGKHMTSDATHYEIT